jgi:hypothetical protein
MAAAVALCTFVAVIILPSTAMAGGGSVPGGNCGDPPATSTDFCSYFQPDQGPPGLHSTFWITCPEEVTSEGSLTPQYIDVVDVFANAYVLNNSQQVPMTKLGHLVNGEGGYYNPGAGFTAWYNDVEIPVLPGYPAVLVGYGSCAYEYSPQYVDGSKYWYQTEPIPENYLWITKPQQEPYKFKPKELLYLSWGAVFGSARALAGDVFRTPKPNFAPLIGPTDTTTTTEDTTPATPTTSTASTSPPSTPSSTRSEPTTTTTTTSTPRGRR